MGQVEIRTQAQFGIQPGQVECGRHGICWAYSEQPDGTVVGDAGGMCGECLRELKSGSHVSCGEHGIVERKEGVQGCPNCARTLRALAGSRASLSASGAPAFEAVGGGGAQQERPRGRDAEPGQHLAPPFVLDGGRNASAEAALSGGGAGGGAEGAPPFAAAEGSADGRAAAPPAQAGDGLVPAKPGVTK